MSEYKYKVLLCLAQNTYSMLVCWLLLLLMNLWFSLFGLLMRLVFCGTRVQCWALVTGEVVGWCCDGVCVSLWQSISHSSPRCLPRWRWRGEKRWGSEKKEELVSSNEEWRGARRHSSVARNGDYARERLPYFTFCAFLRRWEMDGPRMGSQEYIVSRFFEEVIRFEQSRPFSRNTADLSSWAKSAACFRCTSVWMTGLKEPFNLRRQKSIIRHW